MTIAALLLVLFLLGVVGYAAARIPMDRAARIAIRVVIAVVAVCVVLQAIGMVHLIDMRVPRLR